MRIALLALGFFALVACASGADPAPAQATSSSAAASTAPAPELTGRYAFALDESAPAATLRTRCTSQSGGDASKADACYAQIRAQAAKEGIRFEKDAKGGVVWVSYGEEDGAEAVYHTVPVSVVSDGPSSATVRTLARATGIHADSRPIPEGLVMRIEIVDGSTLAMNDPKKGRLVFHRVAAQ